MKVAIISDIHANLVPLEAVVGDLLRRDVNRVVCLGDVATLGAQPRQVLDLLQAAHWSFVMGNHDAAVLAPVEASDLHIPAELMKAIEWSSAQITDGQRDFIRTFRNTCTVQIAQSTEICCYHGSPEVSYELVLPTMSEDEFTRVFHSTKAEILAGGHIHQQLLRRFGNRTVMNPGSVGSAWLWNGEAQAPTLMPWAEYAVVEVAEGATRIEMIQIPFDTEKAKRQIADTDSPMRDWWLTQY